MLKTQNLERERERKKYFEIKYNVAKLSITTNQTYLVTNKDIQIITYKDSKYGK